MFNFRSIEEYYVFNMKNQFFEINLITNFCWVRTHEINFKANVVFSISRQRSVRLKKIDM